MLARPFLFALASLLPACLHAQREVSKPVVAHFMLGNTYPYTQNDWARDMILAASKGIDGFALNLGNDPWQLERMADAYAVARSLNSRFTLFPSFDMGSIPCHTEADGDLLRSIVMQYHDHPNQLAFKGAPVVSTFGGQRCFFGQKDVNRGWHRVLKTDLPPVHYVASFFMDPAIYGSMSSLDGAFSWDSAWPMGNYDINDGYDRKHREYLGGRTYMAGVSPWFFTHYGPDTYNKNFLFRSDNWLLAARWEILIRDRNEIDIVQIISWNDYGECHYMGPIEGAQPMSESWTTGFDHQGWLDLQHHYITTYKTGNVPTVQKDRVFMWGRLYPAYAESPDPLSRPLNFNFTEDYVWAMAMLQSPAHVELSCGDNRVGEDLPAGLSRLRLPLAFDCSVSATVQRRDTRVLEFSPPGFRFSTTPQTYNFNALVAASP